MLLAAGALGAALQLDPSLAEAGCLRGIALLSSAAVDPKTAAFRLRLKLSLR